MLKRVKKLSILLVVCMMVSILGEITTFADYPIFYQRYTADPSGLEANGRLYLYCSHDVYDPNRPGYIMNDITCISTDDLKNWTDHGEVFKAPNWGSKLSWAPVVVTKNNKYYMYFGNSGGGIGVAVSDSPTGPFKDPIGKALITGSSPGVNPPNGFWCFDPGVLVDDDGQSYIYFGGGNVSDNARAMKLGSDMISTVGSAVKIPMPNMFEDSWIHKYKGKYYYSSCIKPSNGTKIDYMMSDNPMSGFVYKGTVLDNPPDNEGNNNHHAIFSFKGEWYIAYHNRAVAIANGAPAGDARTYQRSVCIDKLDYNADGTMQKVTITKDGLAQIKRVDPYVANEAETMAQESGINTEACTEGGRDVNNIENGDWVKVRGVDFGTTGATSFEARAASATNGGNIEIRIDSITGKLVGNCDVKSTGGWQTWATESCNVSGATGVHDLYLKFTGGSGYLFNLNWWKFKTAPSEIIYGDLDGNGSVNVIDFSLLKKYMLGSISNFPSPNGLKAADLDSNGKIDAFDFVLMKKYLLGIITKFPAEK